jgi:hypothetical protein
MSLVDNLRQQRQTPQALWLQFITAYDDKRYTLYIFIEGKTDSAYYLPELRLRSNNAKYVNLFVMARRELLRLIMTNESVKR